MVATKAAPAPPSSTTLTAQPATAVVKAAPPLAGAVSVGSATSAWLSTGSTAAKAGPHSQGPEGPTGPTPNATESTPAASFAANVGSAGHATPNAETVAPNTEAASAGHVAAESVGAAPAKAEAANFPAAAVSEGSTPEVVGSEAVGPRGAAASVGSATSADGGPDSGLARGDEGPRLEEVTQIWPPTSTGSNVAGSAATIVDNPLFWQVGEGACPNVWWTDCSQEFAAALHQQRNAGIRRGRYFFYGHMAQGAIPFVHDFDERVQTNERTGKRKRIRLLQNVSLD